MRVTLPWVDLEGVRELMGEDHWRYGFGPNLPELEAAIRWSAAEGLSSAAPEPAALFHPATLDLRGV
jgi:hypothetical protein